MSGDGAGASSNRGFAKPASRSQSAISAKVKVSPASVCRSMLTAKIRGDGRAGSILVRHELADDDGAAGSERSEGLAQELPAPVRAFAVENVADRGHLVAGAKIRLQEIARHRPQPVPHTVPPGQLAGHLQHRRPIHRANGHVRGLVRQRNSPHA